MTSLGQRWRQREHLQSGANQRRHLGGWETVPPGRKRKKEKKKKRKKKRKKREKREKRKKGTMNSVKLLHIKCCFFQFFNSPVALKKNNSPPREKVEMTPLVLISERSISQLLLTILLTTIPKTIETIYTILHRSIAIFCKKKVVGVRGST